MPKYFFTIIILLIVSTCVAQKVKALKTFSFLHTFQSRYLVLYPDSSFIVSASRAKDTIGGIIGRLRIRSGSVYMDTDTPAVNRLKDNVQFVLLERPSGKELFPVFAKKIFFSDSAEADESILATFISYDTHHGYSVALKKDGTYKLTVWDHMTEPRYEMGTWKAKGNTFVFIPKEKGFSYLDWFTSAKQMFLVQDFLVGRKLSANKKNKTIEYTYLMKMAVK